MGKINGVKPPIKLPPMKPIGGGGGGRKGCWPKKATVLILTLVGYSAWYGIDALATWITS